MTSGGLEQVAHDVSVQFEGLKALPEVTLAVPRERVTGLIGPNGAGKTTLINVLTGLQSASTGGAELEGQAVNGIAAHKLRRMGVARTFQSGRLFLDLPVIDNLEVSGISLGQKRRDAIAEAARVMAWLGISHLASTIADAPPCTDERRVSVGRAIMCTPRYLLLDEPAAGMSEHENHDLAVIIRRHAVRECLVALAHGPALEAHARDRKKDNGRIMRHGRY